MLISVDEALARVLTAVEAAPPLPLEEVSLRDATGRILRETMLADRDMPPFTRSAMDGYALRAADTAAAPVTLQVVEEIPAGYAPRRRLGVGDASKIMTGAALPEGADAVQMVEQTEPLPDGRVRIRKAVSPGEHVRQAGEDLKKGSILLESGETIGPACIGLLASTGHARVRVSRRPRVAIIPTGDELVPIQHEPASAQIRESNGHALESLVRLTGGEPELFAIARDTDDDLRERIDGALMSCEVLLLSGGVSMGDRDLVGGALARLGCIVSFHRVAIQPGKPLLFGTCPRKGGGEVLVFGLPGNPVSTVVDFIVFARPALRRMMGASRWRDAHVTAALSAPIARRPGRRAYLPAGLSEKNGELVVTLISSMGSADMVALSRADALAIIPEDSERLDAGVKVRTLPLTGLTRP